MVSVLEADPELGAGLGESELRHACREALAPLVTVKAGRWSWETSRGDRDAHMGLLVLEGLLTRDLVIGELRSTEFLGAGDILVPWASDVHVAVASAADWRAIAPVRIAVLDGDFALRVRRWPQISAALLERAILRSRSLSMSLAIRRVVRVEDRVRLMLWHLAGRWGHVTRDGTVLPIPLTHETLAQLVGARRSPVTVALGDLRRRGLVERGPRGSWLLHGDPAEFSHAEPDDAQRD